MGKWAQYGHRGSIKPGEGTVVVLSATMGDGTGTQTRVTYTLSRVADRVIVKMWDVLFPSVIIAQSLTLNVSSGNLNSTLGSNDDTWQGSVEAYYGSFVSRTVLTNQWLLTNK